MSNNSTWVYRVAVVTLLGLAVMPQVFTSFIGMFAFGVLIAAMQGDEAPRLKARKGQGI